MTIGILETGSPPQGLQPKWGTYADMIRRMLGEARDYRVYDVRTGQLPRDPAECETYVITGSSAAVYDDLPWIPPLLDFIRAAG
jgi:GMP synthase-like glutamine amidotransferase